MVSLSQIESFSQKIAERFQPEQIILFGSYAYGQSSPDSDVDILVVLPFKGLPVHKAIEMRQAIRSPFPLDLIARTPQYIQQRLEMGDFFIQDILQKGRVLYEASHTGVGQYAMLVSNSGASMGSSIRPIVPRLFINNSHEDGGEINIQEVSGKVIKRFRVKTAVLKRLMSITNFYSLDLYNAQERVEDFLDEDRVSYTPISSIRYDTNDDHSIYLSTLLMSDKASELEYIPIKHSFGNDGSKGVKEVQLNNGATAMLFNNPLKEKISNQIAFVSESRYYVTIASDLSANQLIKITNENLVLE